jgi:glycosyltransferase involved in cell wall biosynthesis
MTISAIVCAYNEAEYLPACLFSLLSQTRLPDEILVINNASTDHYPYIANSDFHKPKHMYSWKTLVRCAKNWDAIARTLRENVDVALTLYRNGAWAA